MKKIGKLIAVFAAAALVVTGFSACGDKPGNNGGGSSGGNTTEKSTAQETTVEPVKELTAQEILAKASEAVNSLKSYALTADMDVTRLHYIGTDMATNYMRGVIDEMEEDFFNLYLQYHFTICERGDMVGTSHHILDVLRKNTK